MKKKTPYRVILISVDAVAKPDAEKLLSLPAFKFLAENGVFSDNIETVYPTITYPIHASAITGKYPNHHNVPHNKPFQPDMKDIMKKWYWAVEDIGTKTLWHAAKEKGLKTASLLWPVSGKARHVIDWDFPEVMPLPGENPVIKMLQYSSPMWLLYTEIKYGKKVRQSMKREHLDDYMTFLTEKLIEQKYVPDLITVHFADTDDERHNFGVGSPEDEAALVRMDRRLQRIIDAVKKRDIVDSTVFVVMSDHGQENVCNGYIELDKILAERELGRAQSTGMGALIYPEDYQKTLDFLKANRDELHIEKILEMEDLANINAPSGVALSVDAAPGYGYVERGGEDASHIGDHGFGMSRDTSKTLLWLFGKPFAKGKTLEKGNIVDIAPTIAKIMELDLPECDGSVLYESLEKF